MKRNRLYYAIALAGVLVACNAQEDDLQPSGRNRNWLQIEDKPGAFNQLVYDVYRETGMPIFVNDTLGSEERGVDAYGNPVVYYDRYVPGYGISSLKTDASIILSADTAAMTEAVRVIREQVIPRLPSNGKYRPGCILLADTLYSKEYDWSSGTGRGACVRDAFAYRDMTGIVVGGLADILKKNDEEKVYWAGMILANNIEAGIRALYDDQLAEFYAVTDTMPRGTFYNRMSLKDPAKDEAYSPFFHNMDYRDLGFLEWRLEGEYYLNPEVESSLQLKIGSPTKSTDVVNYIAAWYTSTEAEFQQRYARYPKCLKKYAIIKGVMEDFEKNYAKPTE